jgi:hypothetical protein
MAAMNATATEAEIARLWELACVYVQFNLIPQAIATLEVRPVTNDRVLLLGRGGGKLIDVMRWACVSAHAGCVWSSGC